MQAVNVEPNKLISLLETVANLSPDPKQVSEAVTLSRIIQTWSGITVPKIAWRMPAAA